MERLSGRHKFQQGIATLDDKSPYAPLDYTDWLTNNGYMQAEGVANLDQVPPVGALVAVGFPRFKGGTGG